LKEGIIEHKKYKLIDFVHIPLKVCPVVAILKIIDIIIFALVPSIQVLVTANIIDSVEKIYRGEISKNHIYISLLLLALMMAFTNINRQLVNFINLKIEMKMTEYYKMSIIQKRAKLKYQFIENNDTWELISRTCTDYVKKMMAGFASVLNMVLLIIQVISILCIIIAKIWIVGVLIILVSIPLFAIAIKLGEQTYEANKEAEKHRRRARYFHNMILTREGADERTLFGYSDQMNKVWYQKYENARIITAKTELKNYLHTKGSSIITVFLSMFIVGTLLNPLASGKLSLGTFIALIAAALELVQVMSWQLSGTMNRLANHKKYLDDLTKFMSLEEEDDILGTPEYSHIEPLKKIEFRNVSFRYPDTKEYILKNFSFVLMEKKHYAIVGVNGAGKTTLTKLLLGLYKDYEGEILINNKELKAYRNTQLKAYFNVVYQDFARYSLSIQENIELGDTESTNKASVEEAIHTMGLNKLIEELPEGRETVIGKESGKGVDLSGGQWQKVAIARAMVSRAQVTILDEPTAALDPVAESEVYHMFDTISKGKTTLFITHRLGAARLADEIIVINNGRVEEKGSHNELINKNCRYAEMFLAQRSWYDEKEE
jgi:ATP-binding cassette subfamily B protein